MKQAKKQMRDLDRRTKIDAERSEIDENHAALRAADDRRAADRREAREFWQEQLQRNDQQRKLGKDADDVLKRPVAA